MKVLQINSVCGIRSTGRICTCLLYTSEPAVELDVQKEIVSGDAFFGKAKDVYKRQPQDSR